RPGRRTGTSRRSQARRRRPPPARQPRQSSASSCGLPPDPTGGRTSLRFCQVLRALLLIEPIKQDLVVGALHHLELLRDAPGERLLVQRNVGPVLLLRDLVGVLDHLVALPLVRLDQDLVSELLDLLVAVAAEIIVPAGAFFVAAA